MVIFCGLYMYGSSSRVFPPSLFPIVLSSQLEMSRCYLRYLRHVQGSSSDDENEEDTIATLHVAQAQLSIWVLRVGAVLCRSVIMFIMIEKLHIGRCIVIIFHKIQSMVQLSFDAGLQLVHNLFVSCLWTCFHLQFSLLVFIHSGFECLILYTFV
jgi:hypothetical protein